MNIDFVNFFNRTDRLNLDISNRCPLECPHCIRQTQYKNSNIDIPGEDLSLDSFKKITEFTNAIHFCGQLSDPIHHPMFIDFLKICFDKNIDTSIAVASSFKSLDWFVKAFKANPNANWIFGIDGLPKDSKIYRKHQDGEKLYKVMIESTKYLNVKPTWQYIVFSYNENDVTFALNLAKENNINFMIINSARWDENDKLKPSKEKSFG